MKVSRRSRCAQLRIVLVLCLFFLAASASFGLILGIDPHGEHVQHIVENLPLGVEEMIRLPSCSEGWEGPPFGGGQYWFEYASRSVEEFNQALAVFAAIRRPELQLAIHDGPKDPTEAPPRDTLQWRFTVWHPASWHRLHSNPDAAPLFRRDDYMSPVPAPRLDVYVVEGAVDWDAVVIPVTLTVSDMRVSAAPVAVEGGGLVRGVVYDMSTGRPISGARVTLTGNDAPQAFSATTDGWGAYQIEKIGPPGRFSAKFRADGYATRVGNYHLRQRLQYDEMEVELVEAESVEGVALGMDGEPIPGVEIEARSTLAIDGREYECEAEPTTTDAQGRFLIQGLPRGYARLDCRSRGLYKSAPFDMVAAPSEDVELAFEVTGTIRGNVVDAPTDERVHIHVGSLDRKPGWGGGQLCKQDGSFAFEGVPPGRYWISTVSQDILDGAVDPTAKIVEVKPGATVVVDVFYTTYGDIRRDRGG
ncbi:MAG: carboxypeptidase regulatory-like domain-containing protein [Armatimonadota bacterium]